MGGGVGVANDCCLLSTCSEGVSCKEFDCCDSACEKRSQKSITQVGDRLTVLKRMATKFLFMNGDTIYVDDASRTLNFSTVFGIRTREI
ncbi:MAG: hypothetical protein QXR19_13205 [Candidatus Jordarchaeaceae archaeon]